LRAYTAKDGSSEAYQPGNIPFQPEAYLKLNRSELAAGDPIITLGFPGSTYRLESSYAFKYYEKSQFPFLEKAFQAYLNGLELAAERNPAIGQQSASERASIANTLKYFNGVRKGFEQHQITKRKTDFDRSFQEWAEADSLRNLRYGRVLSQLKQSYDIADQTGDVLYLTFYALQFSKVLQAATLFEDLENRQDEERWSAEQSRERLMLFDSHRQLLSSAVAVAEKAILKDLLHAMAELPFEKRPLVFYRFFEPEESHELKPEIDAFVERRFSSSVLTDTTAARNLFFNTENPSETLRKDSLYVVAADIREMLEQSRENYIRHFPYLQPAQERYVEGITTMSEQKAFQADANFTLRLSFGEIMGFSPEDAVYKFPFTSVAGMVEKHRGSQPFNLPDQLLKHYESETQFHNLPVNFLSTNDITGGNSGSPALNKNGELVGVVFDGNIEGIASDYYFIPNLTRALSVDVRFILFMMEEMDKTEQLLNELEIVAD
ncbi:S46 family peptidase, partial [Rhodohalobacter halophilus]|uniref:S46 family peptidase n=1 Tax=Rhodohalobacter halophilus TaxID=1812810 RepID=UPI000B105F4D